MAAVSLTQSIPSNALTKVQFDTVTFDPGGCCQLANNRYVCPSAGYYQVNGSAGGVAPTNATMYCVLGKNGSIVNDGVAQFMQKTWQSTSLASDIIQCAAGDYLELWFTQGSTAAMPLNNTSGAAGTYVYLSAVRVA
jgi:hypothetical protein